MVQYYELMSSLFTAKKLLIFELIIFGLIVLDFISTDLYFISSSDSSFVIILLAIFGGLIVPAIYIHYRFWQNISKGYTEWPKPLKIILFFLPLIATLFFGFEFVKSIPIIIVGPVLYPFAFLAIYLVSAMVFTVVCRFIFEFFYRRDVLLEEVKNIPTKINALSLPFRFLLFLLAFFFVTGSIIRFLDPYLGTLLRNILWILSLIVCVKIFLLRKRT